MRLLKKILKKKILPVLKKVFRDRKKAALLVVLLILVGFLVKRTVGNKKNEVQFQTAQVEKGMLISSVSASGQVLSVNVMSANTQASGLVKEVFVKDGDWVKKGDRIMTIELDFQGEQKSAQAWSSYLSAKNGLASAQNTLYSLDAQMWAAHQTFVNDALERDLEKTDPTFIQENDNWLAAEAKYKNQQQVIVQAQIALNSAWLNYLQASPVITAPMTGTITSLMYAEGMSIGTLDTGSTTSNQKVATIKTEGKLIVAVNLSEIDVSRVKVDQQATVTVDSLPNKTFTGKIMGVDRIGQTTSGVTQYPAIIQLDSASEEILPNMTVTANIIIARKEDVLLVPSAALQEQDNQTFANTLVNQKQQLVPVATGLATDTQTEIISGLGEGDVVITGTVSLLDQNSGTSPFGTSGGANFMRLAH